MARAARRYTVSERGAGRAGHTMPDGQVWETDLCANEWRHVCFCARKQEAIDAADAVPHHAVVNATRSGEKLYDNGKPPRSRVDWPK